MKYRLAICIATYQRRSLLADTLRSLLTTRLNGIDIELRVVDNDREASAYSIVTKYASMMPFPVRYAIEPIQNIAMARNRALDMGPADYVAFIDDDEIARPGWLRTLVEAIQQSRADAVFGSVDAVLVGDQQVRGKQTRWFNKPMADTAKRLDWTQTRTSNTLVRGEWFYRYGFRFDASYGRSGGSDTALFAHMGVSGARYHSAPRAVVTEIVDPERLSLGWLLRRRFRGGVVYHRISEEIGGTHPMLVAARRTARAIGLLTVAAIKLPALRTEKLTEALLCLGVLSGGVYAWAFPNRGKSYVEYHTKTTERTLCA
ncbi:glycosyltransferase family 2 protein [Algisphaera agarilytica]|uniref:Succinoglycan biosynthesis protein ExoM n=1 Tax=Algisphaera agarilytica TaxID=1385975 RepID=A0A7X0H313_9BACT|nr:glycosyltransferase family 2 protein [Algisphaera agarilytica]MBB6428285.1 succinoglycan biosynthesis protein ExoM [Algisphaera agarilytica]